jgi:hypothetical protein
MHLHNILVRKGYLDKLSDVYAMLQHICANDVFVDYGPAPTHFGATLREQHVEGLNRSYRDRCGPQDSDGEKVFTLKGNVFLSSGQFSWPVDRKGETFNGFGHT